MEKAKVELQFGADLIASPPLIRRRQNHPQEEEDNEVIEEEFNEDCCQVANLDAIAVEAPRPLADFDVAIVQQQQAPVRQSRRLIQNSLRAAFRPLIDDGDYPAFLESPVIRELFAPAFEDFMKFGQGYGATSVEDHWMLYWDGNLKTRPVHQVHRSLIELADENPNDIRFRRTLRKFEKDLADSHCVFCRLRRNLTVCTYDTSGEVPVYLGLVGGDCWNIHFKPLLNLIHVCRSLALNADHPDFELIARRHLKAALQDIKESPAAMAEAYRHLRK